MRSAPSARSRARLAAIGAAALALLAAAALAVRCRDDASSVRPRPAPVVGPEADPGGLAAPATLLGPHHDARARSADATLIVHIRDELGAPLPARLTFVGVDDTAAPAFTVTDIGRAEPGATLAFDRAFVTGDATLRVAPGHYDVWISHGPEWDAAVARVLAAFPPGS